jgi:hypothetical protein
LELVVQAELAQIMLELQGLIPFLAPLHQLVVVLVLHLTKVMQVLAVLVEEAPTPEVLALEPLTKDLLVQLMVVVVVLLKLETLMAVVLAVTAYPQT